MGTWSIWTDTCHPCLGGALRCEGLKEVLDDILVGINKVAQLRFHFLSDLAHHASWSPHISHVGWYCTLCRHGMAWDEECSQPMGRCTWFINCMVSRQSARGLLSKCLCYPLDCWIKSWQNAFGKLMRRWAWAVTATNKWACLMGKHSTLSGYGSLGSLGNANKLSVAAACNRNSLQMGDMTLPLSTWCIATCKDLEH